MPTQLRPALNHSPSPKRAARRRGPRPGLYPAFDAAELAFTRLSADRQAPRVRTQLGMLPLAVVRPLLTDPSTPAQVVDGIWRTLAGRARGQGGEWILAAVGCALPRLRRAAWHAVSNPHHTERDETAAVVLAVFTDMLLTLDPLPERAVLDELVRPAYNAAQRATDQQRRAHRCHRPLPASFAPPPPPGHPDFVLADLVRDGVITREEAELIGLHRLEGHSLRRIAEVRGWYPMKAHRILRDAEKRVIAALLPTD
jgi:hypothetical protein